MAVEKVWEMTNGCSIRKRRTKLGIYYEIIDSNGNVFRITSNLSRAAYFAATYGLAENLKIYEQETELNAFEEDTFKTNGDSRKGEYSHHICSRSRKQSVGVQHSTK